MQPAGLLTRDELVALVRAQGVRFSAHALLRWVDVGLLPRPQRRGLGQGNGTVSLYPSSAAPQAVCIAKSLETVRNLDDAGWIAWVVGFPLTAYVRDLLLEELRAEERMFRRMLKPSRRGRVALIERLSAGDSNPALRLLFTGTGRHKRATLVRMIAEMQLGVLTDANAYSAEEWSISQDATTRLLNPGVVDEYKLPDRREIARTLPEFQRRTAIPRKIEILREIDDDSLCRIRDEAQALQRGFSASLKREETPIGRGDFLQYLANRYENDEIRNGIHALIRAFGLPYPPKSALASLFDSLIPQDSEAAL